MDANGLRVSDEFRMRSPVVWLCFVVVVLCVLGAESSVRRSFHIIHGQGGPIIRSVIPVNGHRSDQVKIQGRRTQRQDYDEDEDEDEDEEDEEDFEGEYDGLSGTGGGPGPDLPPGGPNGYYEEEDDEEEEEEDEGEEDYGDERSLNEVQGRQAFINNQYVDTPYNPRQNNKVRQQNSNNNNNRRQGQGTNQNNPNRRQGQGNNQNNPNRGGGNGNRPANPNRRRPTASPNSDRQNGSPNKNRQQVVQKTTPTQAPQLQAMVNKQKLQLRPVASSTQFIATPVADLILRLSISLAKPVGHGNSTFNVPIRVHPAPGFSNVIQLEAANKDEVESAKSDPVDSVAVNLVHKHDDLSEEGDDDEEEDKDQGSAEPVTDLPRK